MSNNKRDKYKKKPPKRQDNKINPSTYDEDEWLDEEFEDLDAEFDVEADEEQLKQAENAESEFYDEEDVETDIPVAEDNESESVTKHQNESKSNVTYEAYNPHAKAPKHKKSKKERAKEDLDFLDNEPRAKKKKKKKLWLIPLILIILLLLAVGGIAYYEYSLVYTVAHVEAGVSVDVYDFLKNYDEVAYFAEGSDEIDTHVPGEYHLRIMTGGIAHKSTLYVDDTIAPVFEVKQLTVGYNKPVEASEFVTKYEDATEVTFTYETEPDFTKFDNQSVTIVATDLGGNKTVAVTSMTVSAVATEVEVEAGSAMPGVSEFILAEGTGEITSDLSTVDLHKVGKYPVDISYGGKNYKSAIVVVDTVAPEFEVDDIEGFANAHYLGEDFLIRCIDNTAVRYEFETEPDYTKIGTQEVTIIAIDEGGNQSKQTAKLTLAEDKEDPVIEGAVDITVAPNAAVAYKANVKVRDNCERDLVLDVDSSKVVISEIGTYPVTYTATDASGNTTSVTVNLIVKEQVYDINEVNAMADAVIAKIITPGMTKREMCEAIYAYMHRSIGYVNDSVKGDYVRGAYEGFTAHQGDCYNFASMAKVMLDRLGIANMDIERVKELYGEHYWSIVDIEDGHGWYHFDVTPRVNRPNLCLIDDATITAYSDGHGHCHFYDRSKYPVIP